MNKKAKSLMKKYYKMLKPKRFRHKSYTTVMSKKSVGNIFLSNV